MDNIPMFFKVFLLSENSKNLAIPLQFVSCIGGALPNKALLRNRLGKLWPVKISKVENKFSFQEGWAKFVNENNVENADFLTFRYDGGEFFDVKIFGHNACEKGFSSPNSCVKKEMKVEINDENVEETNDSYVNGRDYEEEMELGLFLVQETCEKKRKRNGKEQTIKKKINRETKHGKWKKSANTLETAEIRATNDNKAKNNGKDEKEFADVGDDDVFKYGIFSRPNNPYFVTKLRATRTNELFIPLDVIRDHGLNLPKVLILKDEKEQKWEANVNHWKDGRTWLTNGWRAFRKWNNFKKEDRCICEFVNWRSKNEIYLKMTILRDGSWLPKENE